MIIGVAIISGCMFIGFLVGDILGYLIGVESNVGGVGFAMFLLLIVTDKIKQKGYLTKEISDGMHFWQSMYIPIVIAMTATQNVIAAVNSGILAIVAGVVVVILGFILVWISSFLPNKERIE